MNLTAVDQVNIYNVSNSIDILSNLYHFSSSSYDSFSII